MTTDQPGTSAAEPDGITRRFVTRRFVTQFDIAQIDVDATALRDEHDGTIIAIGSTGPIVAIGEILNRRADEYADVLRRITGAAPTPKGPGNADPFPHGR
jgi:hypothetical protein